MEQFPDISCFQQLTALVLNRNKLSSILLACCSAYSGSSSSGDGLEQSWSTVHVPPPMHTSLQILALAGNQISSICRTSMATAFEHNHPSTSSTRHGNSICNACSDGSSREAGPLGRNGARDHKINIQWDGISTWLPNLRELVLSYNHLRDLSGLRRCRHLVWLDVSRNYLTDLQVRCMPYMFFCRQDTC